MAGLHLYVGTLNPYFPPCLLVKKISSSSHEGSPLTTTKNGINTRYSYIFKKIIFCVGTSLHILSSTLFSLDTMRENVSSGRK